ncbi:uncharacterized protein PAC_10480 [Phialocephala subalpina]|uniref:Uncharacterized protein n=1 Tax=Phialocephala subalpina TaxID=576137 RepID=A0A1L7X6F2_9HELO|nr:uncharacterized protein PAC_10480 [Phialocephala subalpina]
MADVLGVVASGIAVAQLASSIASSIIKLKGFWSQINDAPAEINHLIRRIDSLNFMLQHMQHDQSQQGIPELAVQNICMRRSLELCEECATGLLSLVNDLDVKLRGKKGIRKKIGSAKVTDLDSAMMQLQPEIILMRLKDHLTTSNILKAPVRETGLQTEDNNHERSNNLVVKQYDIWMSSTPWIRFLLGQFEYQHTHLIRRGRRQESIHAKYRLPELLSCYQVAIWAVRPLSGWWFTLDFHRTLPSGDPFFEAVECGDLAVAQRMLVEKKAYVTDRSTDDWRKDSTPLHVAARKSDSDMCKLLLSGGANPLAVNSNLKTPLEEAIWSGGYSNFTSTGNLLETCRALLGAGADEILIGNTEVLASFEGPLSAFGYLQQQMYPPFHTMSTVSRLECATRFIGNAIGWHNTAFILEELLIVGDSIDPEMVNLANQSGHQIFHRLAAEWVDSSKYSLLTQDDESEERLDDTLHPQIVNELRSSKTSRRESLGYEILFRKLISAGLSVRQVDSDGRTPLSMVLFNGSRSPWYKDHCNARTKIEWMVSLMLDWLRILLQCGIDLQDYGRWESTHFLHREFKLDAIYDYKYPHRAFQIRLIKFDYGPRPEDWKFWLSEPSDPFVGDFWTLIEEGTPWGWRREEIDWDSDEEEFVEEEQPMPGAWSEDF